MIQITNTNKITPLYSDVTSRFKANSNKYQVDQEIFYQKQYLQDFYYSQEECLKTIRASINPKLLSSYNIPQEILQCYPYPTFLVFSSTMGEPGDNLVAKYADKRQIYKSYFIDSWLSESVEKINDYVDQLAWETLGGPRSERFSPGFGDIDITVNAKLSDCVDFSNITVNKASGMLTPRKSTICLIAFQEKITRERWVSFYENLQNLF